MSVTVIEKSKEQPLVSIMIPNYNCGQYLDECIQSALKQTWKNKEIIVLDNDSTDNSLEIARKYINKGVHVCKNPHNVFNLSYQILADNLSQGKYIMLLCSDDYLMPTFVEKAVNVMEQLPCVSYVQAERDFIFENGEIVELDPFYNCSFYAPGNAAMAVYMIAPVAMPSQGMFRRESFERIGGYEQKISHLNADRLLWFLLSEGNYMAYIREKLVRIRIGHINDTAVTMENFQHPLLTYMTIKNMSEVAHNKNSRTAFYRSSEALLRTGTDVCVMGTDMARSGNPIIAEKYLQFARLIVPQIKELEGKADYERLIANMENFNRENEFNKDTDKFMHKRNYMPPDGYEEIELM